MSQFAGNTFGFGAPTIYPMPQNLWGFSPYTAQGQGLGTQASAQQPYGIGTPPPLQQITQLLQVVPQQLQQVQLLQQQQLSHLQQLLQLLPAQLQQLQQLIQVLPQQVQQLQQPWQPFGAGISSPLGFGLVPNAFAGPSQVM